MSEALTGVEFQIACARRRIEKAEYRLKVAARRGKRDRHAEVIFESQQIHLGNLLEDLNAQV